MSINRVNISGHLTRDPELRRTQGGTAVLGFGVAVNDRRKNASGEWEDYPNFVDVTMFGQRAEAVSKYLTKGSKVCLEGKLRYSSWEKDGQRRSKLEVIAEDIEFMTSHQQPAQQPVQQYAQPAAQPVYQAQPMPQAYQQPIPVQAAIPAVYDEEIPF